MKKICILLTIILVLSLAGCADSLEGAEVITVNKAQNSETYVAGEDYQQRWNFWNSTAARKFTMSENGYYYYNTYGDGLLHFYDFATETDVVLCDQANCDHTDSVCNARLSSLGTNVESIQYYDGNLYVMGVSGGITQDVNLYRISADGTKRGKVGTILTMTQGQSVSTAVHRGYVYCALMQDGSLNKNKLKVYRLSLSGEDETEVIHTFEAAYGPGAVLKAYGNHLYISYRCYADKDADTDVGNLYRYNIHTGKAEWLYDTGGTNFAVDNTYLYYSTASEVLAYNMATGEETVLINQGLMHFVIEGDYLYCDNNFYVRMLPNVEGENKYDSRMITVIDRNTFETVAVIPLSMPVSYFIGACGTDLFAEYNFTFFHNDLIPTLAGEPADWETMN